MGAIAGTGGNVVALLRLVAVEEGTAQIEEGAATAGAPLEELAVALFVLRGIMIARHRLLVPTAIIGGPDDVLCRIRPHECCASSSAR